MCVRLTQFVQFVTWLSSNNVCTFDTVCTVCDMVK